MSDDTMVTKGLTKAPTGRRNKIKGIAQEILISHLTEKIESNDQTVHRIIKQAKKKVENNEWVYWFCKYPIHITHVPSGDSLQTFRKYEGITLDRLTDTFSDFPGVGWYNVSVRWNDETGWDNIGLVEGIEGFLIRITKTYEVDSTQDGKVQKQCFERQAFSKLRSDHVIYNDGELTVFESKNYEKSLLDAKTIASALKYPLLFQALGFEQESLKIIYNGGIARGWKDAVKRFEDAYDLSIEPPKLITKYIEDKDWDVRGIKVFDLPVEDNYRVLTREDVNDFVIDLRPLEDDS